ncbi:hypothetical protein GOODEAATRI_032566 [Goodea atripinnis]|uniref:Uncharacterized protein n=1 Tax=Goodea atripinnis TaxID=208336 RepID=A0ABV0P9P0_9TELE
MLWLRELICVHVKSLILIDLQMSPDQRRLESTCSSKRTPPPLLTAEHQPLKLKMKKSRSLAAQLQEEIMNSAAVRKLVVSAETEETSQRRSVQAVVTAVIYTVVDAQIRSEVSIHSSSAQMLELLFFQGGNIERLTAAVILFQMVSLVQTWLTINV